VFFWIPLKLKGIETSVNSYYNNSKALLYSISEHLCPWFWCMPMLWSSDMKVNVVLQSSCGRPKTFQNGQILSIENYNIQDHEGWYCVEEQWFFENDTGKAFQDRHKWKIALDDHLEYKPSLEEHKNLQNSLKIWKRSQTREIRALEKF